MTTIDDWAVRTPSWWDGYMAPELVGKVLTGVVTGHSRKPDGTKIETSRIVAVVGRIVTTQSGSSYMLGTPSQAYVEYLAASGRVIDEANPIRMVTP